MNLFKKAFKRILIAVLSVGLVTVPASLNNEVEVVNAKNLSGGEVLYLKPNSNWTQANARFATYFFNNTTNKNQWVSMTKCVNDAGYYKVTTPSGTWEKLIFCRMNPSATANNWNNKWNQTGDLTYDGTKNLFTVPSGAWDGSTTTWSKFTETQVETFYDVTYYDGNNPIFTESVKKNDNAPAKFKEKEGYALKGWYKESTFKTKFDFNTPITANTNLYAKYVEASDYTIKLYDVNSSFKNQPYIYLYNSFGGYNEKFPGKSMGEKSGIYYTYKIDASKSYDGLVFSDVKEGKVISQTLDINLGEITTDTIFSLKSQPDYINDEGVAYYNYFIYNHNKPGENNTKVRIFLYNENKWSKVYCYAWDDKGDNTWPGKEMSRIGSTNYYYFDTEVGTNVIFNNNAGSQTADLVVPSNGKNVFSNKNTSNSEWYYVEDLNTYYQEQKIEGSSDKVNVRFVSTFKGLTKDKLANYVKVGFVVGSANSKGETKYVEFETTSMYTSVEVNGSVVSASELGSTYVFTIVIKNVPTGARLCVTPFAQDKNGVDMTIGQTKTFVANAA